MFKYECGQERPSLVRMIALKIVTRRQMYHSNERGLLFRARAAAEKMAESGAGLRAADPRTRSVQAGVGLSGRPARGCQIPPGPEWPDPAGARSGRCARISQRAEQNAHRAYQRRVESGGGRGFGFFPRVAGALVAKQPGKIGRHTQPVVLKGLF